MNIARRLEKLESSVHDKNKIHVVIVDPHADRRCENGTLVVRYYQEIHDYEKQFTDKTVIMIDDVPRED